MRGCNRRAHPRPPSCARRTCVTSSIVPRRRAPSPETSPVAAEMTYDYAIVRVVPRVERGERMNIGVILSCVDSDFLDCRFAIDERRLRALDPEVDIDAIHAAVASMKTVCRGGPSAGP